MKDFTIKKEFKVKKVFHVIAELRVPRDVTEENLQVLETDLFWRFATEATANNFKMSCKKDGREWLVTVEEGRYVIDD